MLDASTTNAFVMKKTTPFRLAVSSLKFEPEQVATYQPQKKPRNHALSAEAQAENQIMSSIRILVEHVIAGGKRCRIVHDVLRNTKAHFDDLVMEIACGLHNFRTVLRYHTLA
jgi:hypothetical protein